MIFRKIIAAWRVLTTRGVGGLWKKVVGLWVGWWTSDHWWVGRIVELRGNIVTLDGCLFDLSSPVIGTPQKAGFLLGNYETGERAALAYIPPNLGLPIVEFGGSVGAMACVSSRHFGNPTQHVVVEANPNLIPVLTRNRDLNGCHFIIKHAALAYGVERIPFHFSEKFIEGSVYRLNENTPKEPVQVSTITLTDILNHYDLQNSIVLFCDVEGVELALFTNEMEIMQNRVKYLCVEFHPVITGSDMVTQMKSKLLEAGFRLVYQRKDNHLFINENL